MRKCPDCGHWTLDFDEYFGRFRCFGPKCGWMPASSAEREIRLLREHRQPRTVDVVRIPELGLTMNCAYDSESDVLLFDFGLEEPTFDLPESDGRMIWLIGRESGSAAGFTLLNARKWGVSEIQINIAARKRDIETRLRRFPGAVMSGRPTRVLIENVAVTARSKEEAPQISEPQIRDAFQEALAKFQQL